MKRTMNVTAFLAMGLLVASSFAAAQDVTLPKSYFTGQATLGLVGASDVPSSKFTEYREVPKGISVPSFNVLGSQKGVDFAFYGKKVRQTDQHYFGHAGFSWLGISFDYNQTPHNMGNDGRTFLTETAPGVWSLSATLRKTLGDTVDATLPTSARTYSFYSALLAPTIASAGSIDLTALRRRGEIAFDLGKKFPFDLVLTYMRELKTGTRGASGGDILGVVTSAIDVAEPLNEVVQDFGFRWAYSIKKTANLYATFNRNIYNNRQDSLVIDNPFRATDLVYTSTSVPGGPAQVRFGTAPDNEASRGAFGFLLKFARQTRVAGDVALSTWTQNAQYLPYTINSVILTPAGAAANNVASLQAQSLDGKIRTTTVNFSASSRPIKGLGVRMRYRTYDLSNKTTPTVWAGSTSGSPDRAWTTADATEEFGYVNANPYSNKTARFDAQVSYDIMDLTLEAALRRSTLNRTYREATSGIDNGYAFSAVFHAWDWVGFRGVYDWAKRTANGETVYGFQADEAERKTTRTGLDIEITPWSKFGVTLAYFRRDVDYPNRPDRIQVSGGVPVAGALPIPGTPSGLLKAKYDTYTVEFDFTPSERAELSAYYTYEKDATTNQWSTTTGANLNNLLNYAGRDKTNTFGFSGVFYLVPEKWTLSLMASHQKVDGFMDITAREAGSFYTPGRTTLIPLGAGGAQDITDFDDTTFTTVSAQLDYAIAKAWTLGVGYWYEKYSFADAFSSGTSVFPQSVLFFLKANDGGYKANVGYVKLNYRF